MIYKKKQQLHLPYQMTGNGKFSIYFNQILLRDNLLYMIYTVHFSERTTFSDNLTFISLKYLQNTLEIYFIL